MIYFKYEGEPIGKGRPRVCRYGTYTPKKTVEYEKAVRQAFLDTKQDGYHNGEALCVYMTFAFSVPKSYSKKKRVACLEGKICHTKKPDIDNCIKAVLDAIQGEGGAFSDDSQIINVVAEKHYAEEPFVSVGIRSVEK